jgi:hypothetical protein
MPKLNEDPYDKCVLSRSPKNIYLISNACHNNKWTGYHVHMAQYGRKSFQDSIKLSYYSGHNIPQNMQDQIGLTL